MAGFLSDIGEFFTGSAQAAADQQMAQAGQEATALGKQVMQSGTSALEGGQIGVKAASGAAGTTAADAEERARRQMAGAESSMGANATQYMQKANQAATAQADQTARMASTQAARSQLQAARTGGLNRGQSALMAARGAGDTYSQQFQQGVESGRNQYQGAANQFQQFGSNQQNLGLQGRNIQGGLQSNIMNTGASLYTGGANAAANAQMQAAQAQQQSAGQAASAGGGMLGGILSGIGSALVMSDETKKENVKESSIDGLIGKLKSKPLDELIKKVRPVDFNYKENSGEDPGKRHTGVMAQDLEKTSMADNVVETPDGKMIDAGQQTMSNTNLIVQLAQELADLRAQIASMKGGK